MDTKEPLCIMMKMKIGIFAERMYLRDRHMVGKHNDCLAKIRS